MSRADIRARQRRLAFTLISFCIALSASSGSASSGALRPPTVFGLSRQVSVEAVLGAFPGARLGPGHRVTLPPELEIPVVSVSVADGSVRLGFRERTKCRTVFDHIYARYGGPHVVARGVTEDTPTHRRIWWLDGEGIALQCYEPQPGKRYADFLQLAEQWGGFAPDA